MPPPLPASQVQLPSPPPRTPQGSTALAAPSGSRPGGAARSASACQPLARAAAHRLQGRQRHKAPTALCTFRSTTGAQEQQHCDAGPLHGWVCRVCQSVRKGCRLVVQHCAAAPSRCCARRGERLLPRPNTGHACAIAYLVLQAAPFYGNGLKGATPVPTRQRRCPPLPLDPTRKMRDWSDLPVHLGTRPDRRQRIKRTRTRSAAPKPGDERPTTPPHPPTHM